MVEEHRSYELPEDQEEAEKDPSIHSLTLNSGTSATGAISWSRDERLAVITTASIYILKAVSSNARKRPGSSVGLEHEFSVLPNIKYEPYDVGIPSMTFFDPANVLFEHRQACLFDRSTVVRTEDLPDIDVYTQCRWSPLGCTSDGRSVIATLALNGTVHIQCQLEMVARWTPRVFITKLCLEFCSAHGWLKEDNSTRTSPGRSNELSISSPKLTERVSDKSLRADDLQVAPQRLKMANSRKSMYNSMYPDYEWRKFMLYSTCICWCPVLFSCYQCKKSDSSNLATYSTDYETYEACGHVHALFATVNRSGYLFLWLVSFDLIEDIVNSKLVYYWSTGKLNPSSLAWHQVTTNEAFVSIGYPSGIIQLHHLGMNVVSGDFSVSIINTIDPWAEEDFIRVTFLDWIFQKDGCLRLIAAKGTDILIFKVVKDGPTLQCLSCEIAPSCHSTPITSLQCVTNKYVLTSSQAASQYFDIENETLPYCENKILRGFCCYGISAPDNLTVLARVSSPNRSLLLQLQFVKPLEISFLPFLSTEHVAAKLLTGDLRLDVLVREYFAVSAAENFVLPNVLHQYCDEPDSYAKPVKELQLYLYFNHLRYVQQTGLRVTFLSQEDIDTSESLSHNNDPVIHKINRQIEVLVLQEMALRCLHLMEDKGLSSTEAHDATALLLIADWLVITGDAAAIHTSLGCYSVLGDLRAMETAERILSGLPDTRGKQTSVPSHPVGGGRQEGESAVGGLSCQPEGTDDHLTNAAESRLESRLENAERLRELRKWDFDREKCALCGVAMPLTSLRSASCANGHTFPRCALSAVVLYDAKYRTCAGCGRKARTKCFSAELGVAGALLNVDECPFCGCRLEDHFR